MASKIRRAPHGARGLKCGAGRQPPDKRSSRPARGAWIEMCDALVSAFRHIGRAPHGARGLKCTTFQGDPKAEVESRAPHGARGLKWFHHALPPHTSRRAPHGARGLKSRRCSSRKRPCASRPARGAWIEIDWLCDLALLQNVAPRTGRVD